MQTSHGAWPHARRMSRMTDDFPARLARRMMIAAWRPSGRARLLWLVAVTLLWLGGSAWAAWRRDLTIDPPVPMSTLIGDMIYAPLTFLGPQPDYANGADLHWQAQVARLAGPLWGITGLLLAFHRAPMASIARWLTRRRATGHAVIWGEKGSADAVAIASSEAGQVVALVDASIAADPARQAVLGAAGVVVTAPAATPPEAFDRAGGARARGFAVFGASDAAAIATALALRDCLGSSPSDVLVAIDSPQVQRAIRQAPGLLHDGGARLRPFSVTGNAVRAAIANADLVADAVARGDRSVALWLWGDSDALRWAAEYALRQCWSIALGAPRLSLAMADATANPMVDAPALRHFAAHMTSVFEADHCPTITATSGDPDTACDATRHIVDQGNDSATLEAAFDLASRMRQTRVDPPPVQAIVRAVEGLGAVYASRGPLLCAPIDIGTTPDIETLVARRQDAAAAALHLDYVARFGGEGVAAGGDWRVLPETFVAANRAAADHQSVKRWDVAHAALAGDALIDALAATEHRRWCADRLLDGWAPSGSMPRDDARKLHPKLIPWAQLDEPERDKDRAQVAAALSDGAPA